MPNQAKNVFGEPLGSCCTKPMTGFYRDGFCRTDERDLGRHIVCTIVTQEFLKFSQAKGNDLTTPAPHFGFPGLKEGDSWCLCVDRWKEAYLAGVAPAVKLGATHINALESVSLEMLKEHAFDLM